MQKNQVSPERFTNVRLGCAPVSKTSEKLLHLSTFADLTKEPPKATKFWSKRAPFEPRTFGNTDYGDCTRAKQANAIRRMQRLEGSNTPDITDEEVVLQYLKMSEELYGGGDNGAFEMDALSYWRKPDRAIRDTKGRAYTIDAFTRVNHMNLTEFKNAMNLAGSHGIAFCIALPWAWAHIPGGTWDIPEQPIGDNLPGSWGYHSMWGIEYNEQGLITESTWAYKPHLITWRAFNACVFEANVVIDSINYWKKKKPEAAKLIDLDGIKKEVNRVSSTKIK